LGSANFILIEDSILASKIRFSSLFKLQVYTNASPGPIGSKIAGVTSVFPTVQQMLWTKINWLIIIWFGLS